MNKKVKVRSLVSGRLFINVPESHLRRTWERKGAVKIIDFDTLQEAIYDPGVEAMFREGMLGIDDMETKIALGLEPEGAEEPQNIKVLDEQKMKRMMNFMTFGEFKNELVGVSKEQIAELARYAIDNEIIDLDKSDYIKELVGIDIVKSVSLNRQDNDSTTR